MLNRNMWAKAHPLLKTFYQVKLDLLFSQCSFEANGHFISSPFIFFVFFLMPCLLRGWRALNIPGQYSFSCSEQVGKGKEQSIYKAIENTLEKCFCTFCGCRQIKGLCLKFIFFYEITRKLFILLATLEVHFC